MNSSLFKYCIIAKPIQRLSVINSIYSLSNRTLFSSIYEKSTINSKPTPSNLSTVDRKVFFSALSRNSKFNQNICKNSSYASNASSTKKYSSLVNNNSLVKVRKVRSDWSESETQKLFKFVSENGKKWKEASEYLGTNRSPTSCLAYYKRVTDTSLVRGKWSKEEEEKLISIIKNDFSLIEENDYAEISRLMDNGRNQISVRSKIVNNPQSIGLLDIVKSQRKLSDKGKLLKARLSNLKKANWSKEDTVLLNYAMKIAGKDLKATSFVHPSPEVVSQDFVDKSYSLIESHNRNLLSAYKYLSKLYPMTAQLRKSKHEEIQALLEKKNSNNKRITWTDISEFISSRTPIQCQVRWVQMVCKAAGRSDLKRIKFSATEIDLLDTLVKKYGRKWSNFVVYFPNRTRTDLSNAYRKYLSTAQKKKKYKSTAHKKKK
ncbi:Myb-like protein L [Smittium culicis]|uniref:Myb-like protein L n=1 Tax=Smittium culicis TaxID=133412 RepID=A0A1R1Y0L5_9FUNG|nr:Myb-like protein L [Smittium culicis]